MAQLFWRSRLKRRARKIILSLPDLPSDIDDNVFIALGTQAAEADKTSKAYDEFLFSEEGYDQMPYEDSVDQVLDLQRRRTEERKGRAELPIKMRIEFLEKTVESRSKDVEDKLAEAALLESQMKEEQAFLAGSVKGENNGFWEGVSPETTSRWSHVRDVLKEWLVFVLVAAADFSVVIFTLYAILPKWDEALIFALPAIGVQILFPLLTGKAIASYRANRNENAQDYWVALGIGVVWFAYVVAMSILRFDLLRTNYAELHKKAPEMAPLLSIAAGTFTFLILIGLGSWVLIRAMNSNPHKGRASRLKFAYLTKQKQIKSCEEKLKRALSLLESEKHMLAEVAKQWELRAAVYDQVSESAKSVYRRALVNNLGSPEFTTEYLPESKFKLRGKKRGL
jgi:hypothetical protein